tara:strand:- start:305 stop:478 length:174 start_codon:yes stop_codon:yes gene_type:complete
MLAKHQIHTALDNMDRFGGSFVASLAFCYSQADPDNQTILFNAFEATFTKYANFKND